MTNPVKSWTIHFKGGESYSAPNPRALCVALAEAQEFEKGNIMQHMICLANRAEEYSGRHINVSTYEGFIFDLHASGFATVITETQTTNTNETQPES